MVVREIFEGEFEEYFVSPHARERYAQRVGGDPQFVSPEIRRIVTEAIAAERKSKRQPAWASWTSLYRPRNKDPQKLRYVWDVHEQICFLLKEKKFKGRKCWHVVTCITRKQ